MILKGVAGAYALLAFCSPTIPLPLSLGAAAASVLCALCAREK